MSKGFNPGRNIGRVSIRVLPDTKNFNKQLRDQLREGGKKFKASVKVDLTFDTGRLFQDVQDAVDKASPKVKDGLTVKASIDQVSMVNTRRRIEEQLDDLNDNAKVNFRTALLNRDHFKRQVKDLVDEAERNQVDIPVAVSDLAATAELAWVARDRMVTIFTQVNQAALVKTATTLAALSGTRLAGTWLEDIADFGRDLDKNLPKILNWTTGLTSLTAALFAATSGIVGIGAGLFSITPALLVVPGLALNAIGSLTALIVAWRNASTELAPLADGMRELGDIINTTYWDRARQPILNLVNGLLPQMRNAFRDLSSGVGEFTAALADAFAVELSGGRFESIFSGIAEGWRILGTGAGGFAGAIVSLSQIAATYTPRLASWFVRQANTFDTWLKAISEDGRLSAWMEGAIKSMYDLWDATTGIAGVFEGLWTAAEGAGPGGLAGFADLMQTWEKTVKSAEFQSGLTAIFRGSSVAMGAFSKAVTDVGRLLGDQQVAMERFIGSAGIFAGGLIESIANALNSPVVAQGLNDLSAGLLLGLERIQPSLQPIADTFGNFLGLLGDLASTLLPTAVGALADLMPGIDSIIGGVREILPGLTTALSDIVNAWAPAVVSFVDKAVPALVSFIDSAGPAIASLAEALTPALIAALETLAAALVFVEPALTFFADSIRRFLDPEVMKNDSRDGAVAFLDWANVKGGIELPEGWKEKVEAKWAAEDLVMKARPELDPAAPAPDKVKAMVSLWTDNIRTELDRKGPEAAQTMWRSLSKMDPTILSGIRENLQAFGLELEAGAQVGGGGFSRGLAQGITLGLPDVDTSIGGIRGRVEASTATAGQWLNGRGAETVGGFKAGAEGGVPGVDSVFSTLRGNIGNAFPNPLGLLWSAGNSIMSGLLAGLRSAWDGVKAFVSGIATWIANNKGPESYDRALLVPAGQWIMGGLERGLERGFGRVKSRVSGMAADIRGEFGSDLGAGISSGLSSSMTLAQAAVARSVAAREAAAATAAGSTTEVNVTMPMLPGETPQEQRENVVKELKWAL